jgi:DNA-binding protein HU-beta
MTKADLISKVAAATGQTRAIVGTVLDAVTQELTNALSRDEKVTLMPFGSFLTAVRTATTGRNPRTGEKIQIPEKKIVKFRPHSGLQQAVAGSK